MKPLRGLIVAIAVACAVPLLFPGDAPFINDEPLLISNALLANQSRHLAEVGLMGSQGLVYGPLPTWLYQGFLFVSRDLTVIVALRALLFTALTAFSLVWLSQTLRLWPWFVIPVVLSPYLWFYSRELWDNSFCVPFSALIFAAYLSFLNRESPGAFATVIASLWALTFIHLMSVALTVPLALHMVIARPRALWRYKWLAIAISIVAIWAGYSYCSYLLHSARGAGAHPDISGWLFPMLGPRYLSSFGVKYFFGSEENLVTNSAVLWILRACQWVTVIVFPLSWAGIVLAVHSVFRTVRRRRFEAGEHAAALALAILVGQIVLNGVTGAHYHPHYYNATWIVFVVFAWFTIDWLAQRGWALSICVVQATGLAATLAILIYEIHAHGGTREAYGPTLANQIQVAKDLSAYSMDTPVRVDVLNYQQFPHALRTLRLLQPKQLGQLRYAPRLRIIYSLDDLSDGRIKLISE